jgi:hypothetical protein
LLFLPVSEIAMVYQRFGKNASALREIREKELSRRAASPAGGLALEWPDNTGVGHKPDASLMKHGC